VKKPIDYAGFPDLIGLVGLSMTDMIDNFIELKIRQEALIRKRRRAALKGWRTRRGQRPLTSAGTK
jgi:hypothetical protein